MKRPTGEQWLFLFNVLVSRWVNSGKSINKYEPASIICIKWDEIGDMATCTHVFTMLKKRFPSARIDVITKPYCVPLIENHPAVDRVFDSTDAWKQKYDFVIELRGTWSTLWKTFRYYPKVRLDRGLVRMRNRGRQLHETFTNFEIIKPLMPNQEMENPVLYPSEKQAHYVQDFLKEKEIYQFVVIHCGARRELRRWPSNRFADLANWIFDEYQLIPVFAGTEAELQQIEEVTALLSIRYEIFTRNLGELSALLKKANLFVGNESGPLQLADAAGIPLVGLFGPGVTEVFYPRNSRAAYVHHVLDCNPCDQFQCVRPENTCMQQISIAEVKLAVAKVLSASVAANNP